MERVREKYIGILGQSQILFVINSFLYPLTLTLVYLPKIKLSAIPK